MSPEERAAREARFRLGDMRLCWSCLGDLDAPSSHPWPQAQCGFFGPRVGANHEGPCVMVTNQTDASKNGVYEEGCTRRGRVCWQCNISAKRRQHLCFEHREFWP